LRLGPGAPEVGWVSLGELATVLGGLGLLIERDLSFRAEKRLRTYAHDVRLARRIVDSLGPWITARCSCPLH